MPLHVVLKIYFDGVRGSTTWKALSSVFYPFSAGLTCGATFWKPPGGTPKSRVGRMSDGRGSPSCTASTRPGRHCHPAPKLPGSAPRRRRCFVRDEIEATWRAPSNGQDNTTGFFSIRRQFLAASLWSLFQYDYIHHVNQFWLPGSSAAEWIFKQQPANSLWRKSRIFTNPKK